MNFGNEFWEYLTVFLAGVFSSSVGISYFFYFFFIKKKFRAHHRTGSEISYPERGKMKMNTQNSQEDLKEAENQKIISEMKTQLRKKDQELKKLNDTLHSVNNNKGRTIDFEVNNSKESTTKAVFFSVPTEQGTFSKEKGSKNKNETTWYKIEYKEDETTGDLFYLPGNRDKRALNQMDLFLKPVCEFENSNIKNPQNITLIKPGKVKLEEGKWIVKEKVRLKLS